MTLTIGGIRRLSLLVLAALAATPAAPAARAPAPPSEPETWSLNRIHYSSGVGAGGAIVVGGIRIPAGSEGAVASRSLVMALQQLSLAVTSPAPGLDGTLPALRAWQTDVAQLPPGLIERYNRERPQFALPAANVYGIGYAGMFDTRYGRFRYRMSAVLFERGARSHWRRVQDPRYAGDFFVAHLASLISAELDRNAVPAR